VMRATARATRSCRRLPSSWCSSLARRPDHHTDDPAPAHTLAEAYSRTLERKRSSGCWRICALPGCRGAWRTDYIVCPACRRNSKSLHPLREALSYSWAACTYCATAHTTRARAPARGWRSARTRRVRPAPAASRSWGGQGAARPRRGSLCRAGATHAGTRSLRLSARLLHRAGQGLAAVAHVGAGAALHAAPASSTHAGHGGDIIASVVTGDEAPPAGE
jgi:hypothetical protein